MGKDNLEDLNVNCMIILKGFLAN